MCVGWKTLPIRMSSCSNTELAHRFQYNDVNFMHVQTHYYCERQVEPCRRLGEVARFCSWVIEILALCLNYANNNVYVGKKIYYLLKHSPFSLPNFVQREESIKKAQTFIRTDCPRTQISIRVYIYAGGFTIYGKK